MDPIVVGTDGSPGADAAIAKVIELAGGRGATVHLVCSYPGRSTLERVGFTSKQDPVDLRGVAYDVLARNEHRLADAGFTVEKHVREGDAAQVLIDVASEQGADLIAVGWKGNTEHVTFLGGTAAKLTHHSPVSVMVVR